MRHGELIEHGHGPVDDPAVLGQEDQGDAVAHELVIVEEGTDVLLMSMGIAEGSSRQDPRGEISRASAVLDSRKHHAADNPVAQPPLVHCVCRHPEIAKVSSRVLSARRGSFPSCPSRTTKERAGSPFAGTRCA